MREYDTSAMVQVRKAVKRGVINKPSICESCGNTFQSKDLHGHHDDYSKPLSIRWLCRGCHKNIHIKDTKGDNNGFSKLTEDDVREIKRLIAVGELNLTQIGRKFGVCKGTISHINIGLDWKHVKQPILLWGDYEVNSY